MKNHRVYSDKDFPNSAPLQELSTNIQQNSNHPAFVKFAQDIVKKLWEIITSVDKRQLCANTYDVMLVKFHSSRLGNFRQMWDDLLRDLNIIVPSPLVSNILLQFTLRNLLQSIIKERNKKDMPNTAEEVLTPLRTQDHQVINYISGFIPFALIKRFSKLKSENAQSFVEILKSWRINKSDSDSFVGYVKEWLEKQSRGYLFQPCWDVHVFFRTLEYVGRKHLTSSSIKKYRDNNLHELLFGVFKENITVQNRWQALLKEHELGDNAKEQLLKVVLKYWIKIRCTAYVKVYIDIRKAKDKKISRKGENALRKQVDK